MRAWTASADLGIVRMNQTTSLLVRLAGSGIHQIRISFDSLNPNTFSILRKKAKFEIFMKNLLDLSAALTKSTKRPRLHFITMPFKNNYHELPDIIRYGRDLGLIAMRSATFIICPI